MVPLFEIGEYHAIESGQLESFKDWFLAHGAKGFRDTEAFARADSLDEYERLSFLPVVFQLIPFELVDPEIERNITDPIKSKIREHLMDLGIDQTDEVLVEILKTVSDQYYDCARHRKGGKKPKKGKISALRANQKLYLEISGRQNERCAVCGAELRSDCQETLDHIVPFSLLGDIPDGANWQILCSICNNGKNEYLTSLQMVDALNWVYPHCPHDTPSNATRYVALMRNPICSRENCDADAMDSRLHVKLVRSGGIAVFSNLRVFCERHI